MAGRRTGARTPRQKVGAVTEMLREGRLVWRLMGDPRVATAAKVMIPVLSVLYFLSPVDLLPDVIPVLGQMDDLAILALALRLFISVAPPAVVAEHRDAIIHGEGAVRADRQAAAEAETVDAEYRVID